MEAVKDVVSDKQLELAISSAAQGRSILSASIGQQSELSFPSILVVRPKGKNPQLGL